MTTTFSQTITDKYLHYRTDFFWDSTLYKSEKDYYYEVQNGQIIQKSYPVLQLLFTEVISRNPYITKDSFVREPYTYYPYKYIQKDKDIYIQYFDLQVNKIKLHREYSLNNNDTVKFLANKNSLGSKYGISVSGFSVFLGEQTIEINGKTFNTLRFLEDHYAFSSHPSYRTIEVYLEKQTLIPIKFVTTNYEYKMRQKKLYHYVTYLESSGKVLQDYTNKKTEDLIIYEQKSKNWTEKQKTIFLNQFNSDIKSQKYLHCLLELLDGKVSFYHYERTILFKSIIVNSKCNELIPKD